MRYILVFIAIIFSTVVSSQDKFAYTEKGLKPKYLSFTIGNNSKANLYTKTLNWIKTNYNDINAVIGVNNENNFIQFSSIKENAINLGKQYFHIKYTIKISFEKGNYKFEPLEIQTKLNSKYDMGWQVIDLKDGASFFKKGKVIKKMKSYVTAIPILLNELNGSLKKAIF